MNGQTLDFENILQRDSLACELVNLFIDWEGRRQNWIAEKAEQQKYIWATDTTKTTNAQLPWKNKTVLPKLCQIRDNLFANYMAALFPKRKWLYWEADTQKDQKKEKADVIRNYMINVIDRPEFKTEVAKMVLDYIDWGNVFATKEWIDTTKIDFRTNTEKVGYVGPVPKRISPADIIFNPVATSFNRTGKFIRSIMTIGDFASKVMQESSDDNYEATKKLLAYMSEIRSNVKSYLSVPAIKNDITNVAGLGSFYDYLRSSYVEVLTYYGDFYDNESGVLHRNKVITIVDRHKLVYIADNESSFGTDGIYHAGWRIRQDTLYAMGPLDNLVGMQYRIDHLENLKADVFDLIGFPPLKIKGNVDDFTWGPMARIHVGDDGDVEVLAPDVQALSANLDIQNLMQQMEEMAGSPKEAMGFRTPGEKTMYEVQRLENAAARIFTTKIKQFEEQILEPLLNDMLEMAMRKLDSSTIRIFDDELDATIFATVTKEDISGHGRIKPMAARNFAERAELVQNVNNFFQSALGTDQELRAHFSTVRLAKMFEDLLDIENYKVVSPYIRLSEQQEAQSLSNIGQEQTNMEMMTPSGVTPEDTGS